MRTGSARARRGILSIAAVLLCTTGLVVPIASLGSRTSGALPAHLGRSAATSASPLTFHGNYNQNETGPSLNVPAGEVVEVAYGVEAVGFLGTASPGQVRFPSAEAMFPTASGPLHLYLSPANATLNASGLTEVVAGPPLKLASSVSFNRSSLAYLSTMGVALMASWPTGTYALNVRWHWTLVAPDGSETVGAWSTPAQLVPAGFARLAVPLAHVWNIGGSYSVCLTGPLAGRSFVLRLSVVSPVHWIVEPAFSVASNSSAPACWSNLVPSSVSPQSGWVHLWETTSNSSFLLYEAQVQLVGPPATHSTRAPTVTAVALGFGVGAAIVAVIGIVRLRRRRRAPGGLPEHVVGRLPPPPPPSP